MCLLTQMLEGKKELYCEKSRKIFKNYKPPKKCHKLYACKRFSVNSFVIKTISILVGSVRIYFIFLFVVSGLFIIIRLRFTWKWLKSYWIEWFGIWIWFDCIWCFQKRWNIFLVIFNKTTNWNVFKMVIMEKLIEFVKRK